MERSQSIMLSHFSKVPLGAIYSVEQKFKNGDYRSCFEKPKGLWVSVDGENDWPSWCQSEMPGWMDGVTRYRVALAAEPRILFLPTPFDLDLFTERFGRERDQRGCYAIYIDWPAVAAEYGGIIIAPYHWSRRMTDRTSWYYGWDCASGCIWNADAIARIEEHREAT